MVKNTFKLSLILLISWLWLPTGDPSDIIPLAIVSTIGPQLYLLISVMLIIYLYKTIKGNTLSEKIKNVKKELRGALKWL